MENVPQPVRIVRCGSFEVDLRSGELRKQGVKVKLQEQPFQVLSILLEHAGEVVTREELRRRLWTQNTFVDFEHSLATAINKVREALGDSAQNPRFIETLPKRGYRFIAPVEPLTSASSARTERGGPLKPASDAAGNVSPLKRDIGSVRSVSATPVSTAAVAGAASRPSPPTISGNASAAWPESSDSQVIARLLGWYKGKVAAVGVLIALVVIAGGYAVYRGIQPEGRAATRSSAPANMQLSQLTTSGTATLTAISADGRYVAYAQSGNGRTGLWLRQIATDSTVQVLPAETGRWFFGLTFTPDGNFIDYVRRDKPPSLVASLYQVPVLGGSTIKLVADVDSAIAFSPDGKQFTFLRYQWSTLESSLMIANSDGSNVHALTTRKLPKTFWGGPVPANPTWSPDGKLIAVAEETFGHSNPHPIALDISTGQEHDIGTRSWFSIQHLAWSPDGKSLLMVARDLSSPFQSQILRVSYPNGAVSRITNDLSRYHGASITANGAALCTAKTQAVSNIWVAAKGDWNHPRQITHGLSNVNGANGLSWTGDGRIAYTSLANGTQSIWTVNPENGRTRKLVPTRLPEAFPSTCGGSPGYITLSAFARGGPNIWRANPDGSGLKQLTDSSRDNNPSCSPDGKWAVYVSASSGESELLKVSTDGGKPIQLTTGRWIYQTPSVSPNGKWIVYLAVRNAGDDLALMPFAGGKPVRTFPIPLTAQFGPVRITPAWSPNSRAINYVVKNAGVSNIFQQSIAGGPPVQVTHYDSGYIFWLAISRDGQLALARGSRSSDVVLIRNFQ